MSEVRLVPPDASWRVQFEREANQIRAAILGEHIEIHHIGSTAINGIYAKPIIDMLLLVDDLMIAHNASTSMQALGYESMGAFGISGRRYFRKTTTGGMRTHHVHAFERGSDHAKRHLAFRDYMNAHPEIAQAYSELKQTLAFAHPNDMSRYMDGKDAFIKHHETFALSERAV